MTAMPGRPVDRQVMRQTNLSTVLNLVRTHGPISRPQLVTLSRLSVGTIVGITSDLISKRLVIERGLGASPVGRKPGLLELHPRGGYAIGVSLMEDDRVVAVALNLLGEIVANGSWRAPLRDHGDTAAGIIATGVRRFLADNDIPPAEALGLGCGLPGHVNASAGSTVDDWFHNWHDVPIGPPLAAALGMPVFVDNIVDCLGSYEKLYGRGRDYDDFLVVTLGRGVGLCVVAGGELYRGGQGGGAEFGHIPAVPEGRVCDCGNRGCLEAYVADPGLLASYRELRERTPDIPLNLDLAGLRGAAADSRPIHDLFTAAGQLLGTGLATLVNLFNPECIIVTGAEVHADSPLVAPMRDALGCHTFSRLAERLELIVEPVDDSQWARGAGSLVLRGLFQSPIHGRTIPQHHHGPHTA